MRNAHLALRVGSRLHYLLRGYGNITVCAAWAPETEHTAGDRNLAVYDSIEGAESALHNLLSGSVVTELAANFCCNPAHLCFFVLEVRPHAVHAVRGEQLTGRTIQ